MVQGKNIQITITEDDIAPINDIIKSLPEFHAGKGFLQDCVEKYKESKSNFNKEEAGTEFGGVTAKLFCSKHVFNFFSTDTLTEKSNFTYQIIDRYNRS